VWTPALAVGVPEIDAQHQELFRQVDVLVVAMVKNESPAEVAGLMNFLGEYVLEHFGSEEALMAKVGYPGATTHKQEHDRFVSGMSSLRERLDRDGPNPRLALELRQVVLGWLSDHIPRADVAMARWIAANPKSGDG